MFDPIDRSSQISFSVLPSVFFSSCVAEIKLNLSISNCEKKKQNIVCVFVKGFPISNWQRHGLRKTFFNHICTTGISEQKYGKKKNLFQQPKNTSRRDFFYIFCTFFFSNFFYYVFFFFFP